MQKTTQPKIVKYVVGFMFSPTVETPAAVALVRKARPPWQEGLLNGIGGHIDGPTPKDPQIKEESPLVAMVREFEEETGLKTTPDSWDYFATCHFDNGETRAEVHYFRNFSPGQLRTAQDEEILWVEVAELESSNYAGTVESLAFLIPLALRRDFCSQRTNEFKHSEPAK